VHESGHLVALYLRHPTKDVFKASIISHKGALGMVQPQMKEELHTQSRESLITDIEVSLAGYVAEKIKYGTTSSGVSQDFKNAMAIAHSMVWSLGMGTSSFVGDYNIYGSDRFSGINVFQLSESTKEKLNKETQDIIHKCLRDVEEILKKEWNIVERFVKELLEKEELEYDEIDAIFKEYGKAHVA
jgi:cell division protease FtsH